MLLELVRKAAEAQPGVRRGLFLDIEGHRNSAGGYDHDMMELQTGFILGYLAPWLSEIHLPLLKGKKAVCPGQREDVPHEVSFLPGGESKDRETTLHAEASRSGQPIYDADSGDYLLPDGSRRTRFDPDEPERKS
ncbi:hypothetical protein [Pseudofrankia inefficax]|uniref:hypothetical protein n=1 Tax=Pseudofrankia inefficax (strain DSM 45817 / CECT 9037 / DDB 130130 / EuI1c) TaxID=298654 RepID=UPI00030D3019|nr:hypothetical protein [Pseudofrankia inefficax]